jgi:hypothetical protein
MTPAIGGAPEAKAMPRDKGSAIRKMMKPEMTSLLQFSTRPGIQSLGMGSLSELFLASPLCAVIF